MSTPLASQALLETLVREKAQQLASPPQRSPGARSPTGRGPQRGGLVATWGSDPYDVGSFESREAGSVSRVPGGGVTSPHFPRPPRETDREALAEIAVERRRRHAERRQHEAEVLQRAAAKAMEGSTEAIAVVVRDREANAALQAARQHAALHLLETEARYNVTEAERFTRLWLVQERKETAIVIKAQARARHAVPRPPPALGKTSGGSSASTPRAGGGGAPASAAGIDPLSPDFARRERLQDEVRLRREQAALSAREDRTQLAGTIADRDRHAAAVRRGETRERLSTVRGMRREKAFETAEEALQRLDQKRSGTQEKLTTAGQRRQEFLGDRSRALTARSDDLHAKRNVWAAEQRTSRVTTDARSGARRVRHANRFQLIESREESPGTWTL
jgi:hypothetical protein